MKAVNARLSGQAAVVLLIGTLLSVAPRCSFAADPKWDVLHPDAFATGAALRQRTPDLTDPLGRECKPSSAALSLEAAVDLALCLNPTTRSAWASAREQAAALGSAQSAWLPSLSATGSETRNFGEHTDSTGTVVSTTQNTRDAALNLSWTLYDFGARDGRITSARHLLDAAAATASSVSQQTVLNVVQSYYGVVAADGGLTAAKETEAANLHSLEVARALRDGGAGTRADVLQAETAYDSAVLQRVIAEQNSNTSRGTLATTLGLPADQPLALAPEPVPTDVPPLTARMTDLMAEAVRQRPDLAAALSQRDSAAANVRVARAAGWPIIAVSAGRSFADTAGIPHDNASAIGISVTVPIFTGFNVSYGVRQAQAALEASDANVDQVRLGVSLGVWNAYYGLQSANEQLTVTSGLIRTAQENEEVAIGRYQAGVGSIVDVLTAQSAAGLARQTRVNAELGWQVARAQLALALGRLSGTQPLTNESRLP